ncbi:unnamed protein product [Bursaphelenchus xylophilus]|uniref:(pine wood nematode) hypothetical protein n=1 Tax=Bursaphelenchus xylophilus TaxID=6326 RepID=A0A1I7RWR9_BURXY|nr:unnamed protein product [Bursaphelenchus xylophilus]CAG9128621.1 unnamed protein product [Bursaphelenchus xylophilus]
MPIYLSEHTKHTPFVDFLPPANLPIFSMMIKSLWRSKSSAKAKKVEKIEVPEDNMKPVIEYEKENVEKMNENNETASQTHSISEESTSELLQTKCNITDDLEWVREPPSPTSMVPIDRVRAEYYPLLAPMHLFRFTSRTPIYFERPVDYWIIWSDRHDCCGIVKKEEDTTDGVPLIIRFGGFWTDKAVRSMYLGCTVRVSAYYKMTGLGNSNELMEIVPRGSGIKDIVFAGIPVPSAFACEWAVISRPAIVRTLGIVQEDISYEKNRGFQLAATVMDCEYNEKFVACQEKWPIPQLKKVPEVGSPVIINYVEVREPHIFFECKDKVIPLPPYMCMEFRNKDVLWDNYVFGWLDIGMEPSRKFE